MFIYKISLIKKPSIVVGIAKHYINKELAIAWAEAKEKAIHRKNIDFNFEWTPEMTLDNKPKYWIFQPNVLGKTYYFLLEQIEVLEK